MLEFPVNSFPAGIIIPLSNVFTPVIFCAPAIFTCVVSILVITFLSAVVIIAPEPALVTSDNLSADNVIDEVPSKATPHIDIFGPFNAVAVSAFPCKFPCITLPFAVGTIIPLVNVFTPLADCATFPVNFIVSPSKFPIWVVCVFNVDVCPLIVVKFVCISV